MLNLLIDSHVHLDSKDYQIDFEQVLERARQAGIYHLISIGAGDSLESAKRVIKLAKQYSFISCSVGVHPHDAATEFDPKELERLAQDPSVIAIGETGLDFFRDWAPREKQFECFKTQIELALKVKKPLIIHSRQAGAECLALLEQYNAKSVGGVFHCFSEDAEFAAKLRQINFRVSFPGSLTFKKATALREIAREIPLEQILLETDGPYMAPEPHRGKRCESAFMLETAKVLATLKGLALEELAKQTSRNTIELFKLKIAHD